MIIRKYDAAVDADGLRSCLSELQDYECTLDPRMPPGADVVEPLFREMMARCEAHDGRIFVAEEERVIAGYVTVLARVRSDETDDGGLEYGLITDLMVRQRFRRRGIGRRLIAEAEKYAAAKGADWLRIDVLANNGGARGLYSAAGFSDHIVTLEKPLGAAEATGRGQAR